MITIKIIALSWTVLMSMFQLVAKVSGTGVLGTMIIKLLSFITLLWAGLELLRMLPQRDPWWLHPLFFHPASPILCVRYIYVVRNWYGSITRVVIHICVEYGCVWVECALLSKLTFHARFVYIYISQTQISKYPFTNKPTRIELSFLVIFFISTGYINI